MADKLPSWKRRQQEQELETWQEIERQGERESQLRGEYFLQGDYLGLEDGRPGVSWQPYTGFIMPLNWRLAIYGAGVVLLLLAVIGWRACAGEERINELRRQNSAPPVATQSTPQQNAAGTNEGN